MTGKKAAQNSREKKRLYALEVLLTGGPVTEEFVDENPVVSRTIQIAGHQSLARLHQAIFDAFDRDDPHLYEFQFGGKRPHDPKARKFGVPSREPGLFAEPHPTASALRTKIDALDLKKNQTFWYWFDFGDDWWHRIKVMAIAEEAPAGKMPRVVQRVGESPPQYPDWEDEDA